jgi:hypothetical protein
LQTARALPVNDTDDQELTISCGCALSNLRVAAADHGLSVDTEIFPDSTDPNWLVRVSPNSRASAPSAEAELSECIERRRTYRKRFSQTRVSSAAIEYLVEAAGREGAWLRPILREEDRRTVSGLVAEGDALQWANPTWRRELAAWMRPRRRGDGLTVPRLAGPFAQFVVRTFDVGSRVGARDRKPADESPLLAVLGTERDEPRDWLSAGQALQRVLLTACKLGLQASYLNQPVQVAALRPRHRDLTGRGFPQIVLRLGYPPSEIAASPRRPLEDVLDAA